MAVAGKRQFVRGIHQGFQLQAHADDIHAGQCLQALDVAADNLAQRDHLRLVELLQAGIGGLQCEQGGFDVTG